jgi:hypothetical protein
MPGFGSIARLRSNRSSFTSAVAMSGKRPYPSRKKYLHQSVAFVIVENFVSLVPLDVMGDVIFLRTIIPSGKATRLYLKENSKRS